MASGSQNMTTYKAKQLVNTYGSNTKPVYINDGVPTILGTIGGQYEPVWVDSGVIKAITAGTTAQFYRGDKSWSNSLIGDLSIGQYTANTAQSQDYQIQIKGGAGGIYIFSQANTNGVVGIGRWTAANAWTYQMYWDQSNNLYIASGTVIPTTNNTGSVGTSESKWASMYATTFYGALSGNADTATALTSNAGGTEQPIYFTSGKPSATSYALKATVNNSTANYMAYYDGARSLTGTSYVRLTAQGTLSIFPVGGSYRDGIRIHARTTDNGWAALLLCGSDNTGDSGTSANSWFLGATGGDLYFGRNGTGGSGTYLRCVSNVWEWNGTANGSISGNAATATKLSNTPNNTTTFLRGDNTWSNALTAGLGAAYLGVTNTSSTSGYGVSLYNGATAGAPTYGIMFAGTGTFGTHGAVTSDWATYFTMSDTTTRGWIFRRGSTNVASIDGTGKLYLGYAANANNPGIYWNPYVESASDASDVSRIIQVKSGVAGGTELQIYQANDAADCINLVTPAYIYLNSKRAFTVNDSWLRINENAGFSSGTYFGATTVRTDGTLQVGNAGANFYANSSGDGKFSRDLVVGRYLTVTSTASSWLDGQRYTRAIRMSDSTDTGSYWPWIAQTNTGSARWFSLGVLNNSFYIMGSTTSRTANSYDYCWRFDVSNGWAYGNFSNSDTVDGKHASDFATSGHTHSYLPLSGGTMTGALTFANGTWNVVGDDCAIGDVNVAGALGIKGQNGTTNLRFIQYGGSAAGTFSWDGTSFTLSANLNISHATSNDMAHSSANPKITFSESGSQPVHLIYTDYDNYRAPAGLKVVGGASASAAWFEVEGSLYTGGNTNSPSFTLNGATSAGTNYITGTAGRIYFGGNFHIDSLGSNATYINYYTANNVYLCSGSSQGKVGIGNSSPSYKLHVSGDIYAAGGWLRTNGSRGWYNESYGGGMYMTDSTWVRVYNSKKIYVSNTDRDAIYTSGGFGTDRAGDVFSIYYSGAWRTCIYNHNNANLSIDAPTGSLYLSYYNGNTYFAGGTYYINRSGYFNGSCASANSVAWTNVSGRPTIDKTTTMYQVGRGVDVNPNQSGYFACMTTQSGISGSWWHVISLDWSGNDPNNWVSQLALPTQNRTGVYYRSQNNGTAIGNASWKKLWTEGEAITGAVWNDYAEYRESDLLPPGACVQEQDNGHLIASDRRLIPGASIISDTWGFSQGQTETAKTPVAVSGRVLAYTFLPRYMYHAGQAVCSAPGGTIDIMTREEIQKYPDAIIGIVSEIPDYEEWGGGPNADRDPVKVNGRIWIKVR